MNRRSTMDWLVMAALGAMAESLDRIMVREASERPAGIGSSRRRKWKENRRAGRARRRGR